MKKLLVTAVLILSTQSKQLAAQNVQEIADKIPGYYPFVQDLYHKIEQSNLGLVKQTEAPLSSTILAGPKDFRRTELAKSVARISNLPSIQIDLAYYSRGVGSTEELLNEINEKLSAAGKAVIIFENAEQATDKAQALVAKLIRGKAKLPDNLIPVISESLVIVNANFEASFFPSVIAQIKPSAKVGFELVPGQNDPKFPSLDEVLDNDDYRAAIKSAGLSEALLDSTSFSHMTPVETPEEMAIAILLKIRATLADFSEAKNIQLQLKPEEEMKLMQAVLQNNYSLWSSLEGAERSVNYTLTSVMADYIRSSKIIAGEKTCTLSLKELFKTKRTPKTKNS